MNNTERRAISLQNLSFLSIYATCNSFVFSCIRLTGCPYLLRTFTSYQPPTKSQPIYAVWLSHTTNGSIVLRPVQTARVDARRRARSERAFSLQGAWVTFILVVRHSPDCLSYFACSPVADTRSTLKSRLHQIGLHVAVYKYPGRVLVCLVSEYKWIHVAVT